MAMTCMLAPERLPSPSSPPAPRAAVPDKWICDLQAGDAVDEAARQVLEQRVRLVTKVLKQLGRLPAEGGGHEAVHQLRVSTRRAQAAGVSFEPWLRRSRRKNLKKRLKRLRDAAGAVRMADVHRDLLVRAMIEDSGGDERATVLATALLLLEGERRRAVRALHKTVERTPAKDLLADSRKAVRARREEEQADGPIASTGAQQGIDGEDVFGSGDLNVPLHAAGRVALSRLATELRTAWQSDLACRENLHNMRLCGKRLRYAIEIFGCATDYTQRERLIDLAGRLSDFQERLGAINDQHEVAERLARYAAQVDQVVAQAHAIAACDAVLPRSRLAVAFEQAAVGFEARCSDTVDAFTAWWTSDGSSALRHGVSMLASLGTAEATTAGAYDHGRGSGAADGEVEIVVIGQPESHITAESIEHADAERNG